MAALNDHAPIWLFSFVDLSFLLLIAMTQIGRHADAPDLGLLVLPRVHGEAAEGLAGAQPERWQIRVHPRPAPGAPAFELARPADGAPDAPRLRANELRERLASLRAGGAGRPLLAPHADSRSEDLLEALALLEETWPGRHGAAVLPGWDGGSAIETGAASGSSPPEGAGTGR
jgi:hypothetical protein